MKVTYAVVLGFAFVLMFSLNASAQRTGNNPAVAGTNSQSNAVQNGGLTRRLTVGTSDPTTDGMRRRHRVTTLSMDVNRPSGNPRRRSSTLSNGRR